jgi:hypothetical protein
VDFAFNPANVSSGSTGHLTNSGPSPHSVVEQGGDSLPSYCFGRSFVGNTPTMSRTPDRRSAGTFNLDGMAGTTSTRAQR